MVVAAALVNQSKPLAIPKWYEYQNGIFWRSKPDNSGSISSTFKLSKGSLFIRTMSFSIVADQHDSSLILDGVFTRVTSALEALCETGEIRTSQKLYMHMGARYGQQIPFMTTRSSDNDGPSDRFDLSVCLSLPLWEAVRPYAHFFIAGIVREASDDTNLVLRPAGAEASDESCIVRVFTVSERVVSEASQPPGKRQREEEEGESGQAAE